MQILHERQKAHTYLPISPEAIERHGTEYNELQISVNYDLGGMNFFTGKTQERGYRLTISPITVTKMADGGKIESFTMMGKKWESGLAYFIEGATRYNRKRLEQLAAQVDERLQEIATMYEEERDYEILDMVVSLGKDAVKPQPVCA